MKVGVRKPSIKRSVKARTTGRIKREAKKAVNPFYGKKGMGWIKDPEKALYNKVYHKTTVGVTDAARVVLSDDIKDSINIKNTNEGDYNYREAKDTSNSKIGIFLIVAGIVLIVMSLLLMLATVVPGLIGASIGVFSIIKGSSLTKAQTKKPD